MTKLLAALAGLIIMNNSAMADWVPVIGHGMESITYADPATIRKSGSKVKMWVMDDYKTAQQATGNKLYMSTKSQEEYDCKEEQWRGLYFSSFSGNMGNGDMINNVSTPSTWLPVAPGSIVEGLFKFACK